MFGLESMWQQTPAAKESQRWPGEVVPKGRDFEALREIASTSAVRRS